MRHCSLNWAPGSSLICAALPASLADLLLSWLAAEYPKHLFIQFDTTQLQTGFCGLELAPGDIESGAVQGLMAAIGVPLLIEGPMCARGCTQLCDVFAGVVTT